MKATLQISVRMRPVDHEDVDVRVEARVSNAVARKLEKLLQPVRANGHKPPVPGGRPRYL